MRGAIAIFEENQQSLHSGDSLGESHNEHAHGHGPEGDVMMGGHLATEVVEKIGHSAHHAAEHGGHVASKVAHNAGHEALTQVADVKSKVSHAVADSTHHAFAEVSTQAAVHTAEHGTDLGHESLSELSELSEAVHGAAHEGGKAAGHLSTGLSTALAASAGVSGLLGVALLSKGVKEGVEGVKEGNVEKMAEGVGGVAVGTRSVAAATVMSSMVSGSRVLADVASVASKTLTPLGIVHGAVDIGLGVKDLVDKKPVDGFLKIGLGASITAGAVVGGLPLTFLALGFVGAKVGRAIHHSRQSKSAAAQHEPLEQHQPTAALSQAESKTSAKETAS